MARTPGMERVGTSLPASALPPPPDLSKVQSDRDLEVVRVSIGVDPQQVLDLYADKQDQAAEIRAEISEVSAYLKDLKAYYYGNGSNPSHYERERKLILSQEMVRIVEESEKKPSDKLLDAMAHSSRAYRDHLERGRVDARVMADHQQRLDNLYRELETVQGALEYLAKAHKSVDSLIYFATQNRKNGA